MITDIINQEIDDVAIYFARSIYKSGTIRTSDSIRDTAKCREEGFNFSQIEIIVTRTISILRIIKFLKKQNINGKLTDVVLKNFSKKHNYDIYTLTIAAEIMSENNKETNIMAFSA